MGFLRRMRERWFPPRVVYRSLENPNLPLNDPAVWAEVFGDSWGTATGEQVTHKKALMYAPVWQAVSLISGDVAKLPLSLYRRRPDLGDDAREKASDDPRHTLVCQSPNDHQTAVKFWRRVMVHALLWGNAYIYVGRNALRQPRELYTLLPDRTSVRFVDGQPYVFTELDGQLVPLPTEDVLHIEGIGLTNSGGYDLVMAARNAIALGLAQEGFASKFFQYGGRQGGILQLPAGMPKPARDSIEEGFRKTYEGTENPFKTVILRDGAKFDAAQVSPRDSQMVEGSEAQVRQIARWFNLAPSKLGLSDSVSYNSKAEDNQAYLDSTLSIWLCQIAAECGHRLLSEVERDSMYFEHNTAALLRMNPLDRYQAYQIGIASKILSPNECRAKENMLPYDGGDQYENPNTSSPNATAPAEPADDEEPEPEDDPPPADESKAARQRVVRAMAVEALHRAGRGGKSFLAWLDSGCPDHRATARAVLGGEELVDALLSELNDVVAKVTEGELVAAVSDTLNRYEAN